MAIYLIIVPLAAAFLIAIAGKRARRAGGALSALAALLVFGLSLSIAYSVMSHKVIILKPWNWFGPAGITLVIDGLSAFMLVTVNMVAFLISVYSIDYAEKYAGSWRFHSLFLFMLTGINGVLAAGDIFNLYVFLEMAAISGYFLVAFGTASDQLEAAFKYAVMGVVASAFILLGIALLYAYTSTLNMADIASVVASKGVSRTMQLVMALFIMGFGLKAAFAPFHAWLPYAHSSAPAPISAMLSGVSIKVLGIYAIMRMLFNVFAITPTVSAILISLGILSMALGAFLAFGQTDIKRLFAYSSISQIGYIALGFGIATPLAIFGALFHLFNHSVFKSLLFLNSGSIENIYKTRDLGRISGVASRSPVTGWTGLLAALSICGIPPLGGFWSKLIIVLACVQANRPFVAFTAAAISILTLAYYFKALAPAFFGKAAGGDGHAKISFTMGLAMIILAGITVASALVLLPGPANTLLRNAVSVLANGKDYMTITIGLMK